MVLNAHNWWHAVPKVKSATVKTNSPLRIGVLSAANINYSALFDPVETHPDVTINAVAARSLPKAQAQIAKYNLSSAKAYGSYDEVLDDPDIDAVYIPLPNGLHFEWAIKSMKAGKHVLIEKTITSNARQAEKISETSKATGKVALEAFHWRFHPATHKVKELVSSGKYGAVQSVFAKFMITAGALGQDDIRFQYDLGGGACLDLAYVFSGTTYYACHDIMKCGFDVLEAKPRLAPKDRKVDEAIEATFEVIQPGKEKVTCKVEGDLSQPKLFGIIPRIWDAKPFLSIELERARIDFPGFVGSWLNHSIIINEKDSNGALTGSKMTEQCYVDGPQWVGGRGARFWTTYRYQLEAFVDIVRAKDKGGKYSGPNVPLEESVKLMELIDAVYEKAGLPIRGV